ncbi:MAG: stage 0 sporulation protein [Ruminococcaceae bacterium]|nr:stage 0 sporulation protein [Oscillospiraceae bacterium]
MTEVIGVRFRSSGKIYYFDNCKLHYPLGCHAIVDTARGMEYGEVAMSNRMVPTSDLVLPLREALRIATPEDDRHYAENKKKEAEAAEVWNKKIAQHNLEMKLIDIECTFDNSKILFYFTAEGRVDFRDLVKDLASVFRCRIELRQMGIRDEAKILGGLGVCGRPFCCHSFLPDFVQVSIKMAKEQNLSLNSAKISGACGRLMCCLRYEYDTYLEEAKLTPKVDSTVRTPDGIGTVVEAKPLLGLVKVQLANSPDATPTVYSRELVKIHKPGDPIDEPVIPTTAPASKEPASKTPESKKQQEPPHRQPQPQRKRQNEGGDKKKAPEAEKEVKKPEKPQKQDKGKPQQQDGTKNAKNDAPKTERKYTIQRAADAASEEGVAPKKKEGGHHRRRNHSPRDRKEKKPGEQS